MVAVALQTGLRYSELVALHWDDIDIDARSFCVARGEVRGRIGATKSHRIRHIPMTVEVHRILASRPRDDVRVFHSHGHSVEYKRARLKLRSACDLAGVDRIGFHHLRHTFASNLARAGVPLQAIQKLLGHSTVQMTERYAHLGADSLRTAIEQLERGSSEDVWAPGGHQGHRPAPATVALPTVTPQTFAQPSKNDTALRDVVAW